MSVSDRVEVAVNRMLREPMKPRLGMAFHGSLNVMLKYGGRVIDTNYHCPGLANGFWLTLVPPTPAKSEPCDLVLEYSDHQVVFRGDVPEFTTNTDRLCLLLAGLDVRLTERKLAVFSRKTLTVIVPPVNKTFDAWVTEARTAAMQTVDA